MTRTIKLLLIIAAMVTILGGCTAKISEYSLVSTENIDLSAKYTLVAENASAKTTALWVLLYFGADSPSYYKAIGDCLAENDGDLMTDVKVTTSSYYFLIGTYTDFKVEGNVWRRVDSLSAASMNPDELYSLEYKDGQKLLVSSDGSSNHLIAQLN